MKGIEKDAQTLEEYIALPVGDMLRDARLVLGSDDELKKKALAGTIFVLSDSLKKALKIKNLKHKLAILAKMEGRI